MATPILRRLGWRAFVACSTNINGATRMYGASQLSLAGAQIVDRSAVPPKASKPPPSKVPITNRTTKVAQNSQKKKSPPPRSPQPKKEVIPGLPTSSWVIIRNIPPLSTLADVLQSVNEVMDAQAEGGIVDLDAVWKGGGQVTMLESDSSQEWVRSAHLGLSSQGRPNAWRIQFSNRSVAHAFLEYSRASQFRCAWKPVKVEQWEEQQSKEPLEVSDSVIRVENAGDGVTVDNIRHLFRRYDLTREGQSVRVFNENMSSKLFLVHFADASWARAAVRELQGVRVQQNFLRLAQYPRQLIVSDDF